jgi:uncharacterized membrane protein
MEKKRALMLALVLLGMCGWGRGMPHQRPDADGSSLPTLQTAAEGGREFMQSASQLGGTNIIEKSVIIERPVESVYEFYRDFRNLPKFLGDVMNIEQTGPGTSRWTIQGPFHIQAHWTIRVTADRSNESICYETVSSRGLRTYWEIYFSPGRNKGETRVREVLRSPLGRLGRAALALIGKFPAEEVSANLRRLKQVMETGRVTDTSYSVPGKFSRLTY